MTTRLELQRSEEVVEGMVSSTDNLGTLESVIRECRELLEDSQYDELAEVLDKARVRWADNVPLTLSLIHI